MPSDKTPTEWDIQNNPETAKELTETPGVEITVAAEGGDVINVSVQVKDGSNADLAQQLSFFAWLSDTAGAAATAAAPSAGVAVGTAGVVIVEHTAEIIFELLTDATGLIDLDIGEAGVDTWFLNVRLAGGTVVSSAAITFA